MMLTSLADHNKETTLEDWAAIVSYPAENLTAHRADLNGY